MNETVDMQVFAVRSLLYAVPVYEADSSPLTSAHVPQNTVQAITKIFLTKF